MLVLSRKIDEVILTSNGIRIKICDIRGDQVRIGIEAADSVGIWRHEVFDRMTKEGPSDEVKPAA